MKTQKPTIITKPVANHYAAVNERIIEFSFPNGEGGLICFSTSETGNRIEVYRTDKGVEVIHPNNTALERRIAVLTEALEIAVSEITDPNRGPSGSTPTLAFILTALREKQALEGSKG